MGAETIHEFQLTSLMTVSQQLQKRKETIVQLDARIAELLTTPKELEEAILDTEEMQDKILEKINQIEKFIELKSNAPTTSALTPTTIQAASPVTSSQPETVSTNTETHAHGTIPTFDVTSILTQPLLPLYTLIIVLHQQ